MGRAMRKRVFGHMRTAKAQISLPIRAVWSATLLSPNKIIEYYGMYPVSIPYKSTAGRYRPVRKADGPIMARYRFIRNAIWVWIEIKGSDDLAYKQDDENPHILHMPFFAWHAHTVSYLP